MATRMTEEQLAGISEEECQSYAVLSPCGTYRYLLGRRWGTGEKLLTYVMLNPSTADAAKNDPTVRKCIGFAKLYGFDRIEIVNLFAYRTPSPEVLRSHGYPGANSKADQYLEAAFDNVFEAGGTVVCAWGANARDPIVAARASWVIEMIKGFDLTPMAIRVLEDGIPSHPLMLAYTNKLVELPC